MKKMLHATCYILHASKQRGAILIFSLLIMAMIMSITFAVLGIFLPKIKVASDPLKSAVALYTADSATEWCLYSEFIDPLRLAMAFDEASGTTAIDSSGFNNNGTLIGGPSRVSGKNNGGLSFDGANDYVDVNNGSNFNFEYNKPISITAWAFRPNDSQNTIYLSKYSGNRGYSLGSMGGGGTALYFVINANGPQIFVMSPNGSFTTGVWHHIAVTYNGNGLASGVHIYQDGVDMALNISSNNLGSNSASNNQNLQIGANTGQGYYGQVTMDDVRVYRKAITQAEVQSDMNSPVPLTLPPVRVSVASPVMANGATYGVYYPSAGIAASDCEEGVFDHRIVGTYQGVARSLEIRPGL